MDKSFCKDACPCQEKLDENKEVDNQNSKEHNRQPVDWKSRSESNGPQPCQYQAGTVVTGDHTTNGSSDRKTHVAASVAATNSHEETQDIVNTRFTSSATPNTSEREEGEVSSDDEADEQRAFPRVSILSSLCIFLVSLLFKTRYLTSLCLVERQQGASGRYRADPRRALRQTVTPQAAAEHLTSPEQQDEVPACPLEPGKKHGWFGLGPAAGRKPPRLRQRCYFKAPGDAALAAGFASASHIDHVSAACFLHTRAGIFVHPRRASCIQ